MMRVQIRDKEALGSLTPENLRAYLESQGWGNDRPWGQWGTILSKEQKGKLWEIVVPLRDEGYGYAEFMGLMVATLAEAEDRSQLDVFGDMANWSTDWQPPTNHEKANKVPDAWRVGAEKGKYTDHFVDGGYAAIGWLRSSDLTGITDKEELRCLYKKKHPQEGDKKVAANVGQIRRFLVDIQPGDFIITPTKEHTLLRHGRVESGVYYEPEPDDGCPFPHRRRVDWAQQPLNSKEFPEKLYNAMKFAELTVFSVHRREEFLAAVVKSLWSRARWL